MKQKYIKIFVVVLTLFSLPAASFAARWNVSSSQGDRLSVSGPCEGSEVMVYLYPLGGSDPIYSAGANCYGGSFFLDDNLSRWNLPEGQYTIAVGSRYSQDRSRMENFVLAHPAAPPPPPPDPNAQLTGAANALSANLNAAAASAAELEQGATASGFSSIVQAVLNELLSLLQLAMGKATQLLAAIQTLIARSESASSAGSNVTAATPSESGQVAGTTASQNATATPVSNTSTTEPAIIPETDLSATATPVINSESDPPLPENKKIELSIDPQALPSGLKAESAAPKSAAGDLDQIISAPASGNNPLPMPAPTVIPAAPAADSQVFVPLNVENSAPVQAPPPADNPAPAGNGSRS